LRKSKVAVGISWDYFSRLFPVLSCLIFGGCNTENLMRQHGGPQNKATRNYNDGVVLSNPPSGIQFSLAENKKPPPDR
jgi:hypothetical protein